MLIAELLYLGDQTSRRVVSASIPLNMRSTCEGNHSWPDRNVGRETFLAESAWVDLFVRRRVEKTFIFGAV